MSNSKLYDDIHAAVIDAGLKTHEVLTPDPELIQFIRRSRLKPRSRILDTGCGCGRNAVFLARQGFEVTAIDISSSAIELTRRLAEESGVVVNTRILDACRLGVLPSEAFQAVIDARCLHNIVEMDMRKIFLLNLFRSLLPEGWYFGMNIGRPNAKSARKINRGTNWVQFVKVNGIDYQPIVLHTKNGDKGCLIRVSPLAPMWSVSYETELAEAGFVDIQVDFSFEKGRRPLPSCLLATARKVRIIQKQPD